MRAVTLLAALILACSSTALAAENAKDSGLSVGARVSVGFPVGDVAKSVPVSNLFSADLPLQVDAGYRFGRNHFVGAYFTYAIGFVKNCPSAVSCSGSDVRVGLQYTYTFNPDASTFWLGAATGWEWLNLKLSDSTGWAKTGFSGWEWLQVQLGYDFRVAKVWRVGPWAGFSMGMYGSASASASDGSSASGSINDTAVHFWPVVGVRGVFEL